MLDCMNEFNYECIKLKKKILSRVHTMKCLWENVAYAWLFVIGES